MISTLAAILYGEPQVQLSYLRNDDSFAYRFGSSWWVYGVGFTAKLNYRNSLYLDLERTSGAYFTQDWAVKAGWRKTF